LQAAKKLNKNNKIMACCAMHPYAYVEKTREAELVCSKCGRVLGRIIATSMNLDRLDTKPKTNLKETQSICQHHMESEKAEESFEKKNLLSEL
jgi:transcription initiation factor TFIIIB Brf1 subunit/transcription initiation factor TFIIB